MHFQNNIKMLRKRKGRTQDEVAFAMNMKRSTLSGYENGVAQPGLNVLMQFSEYYDISLDMLVKANLSLLSDEQLSQLNATKDSFIAGSELRVLATTVDEENEENIELVSEKAKAGYVAGYADPDYIKVLPTFKLPFLSKQKKYRTFQISGDSMLPIPDGSYVTCEYVQDWNHIRNHHAYVILTKEDGVVFKVLENKIKESGKLVLHSLNSLYLPYELEVDEIKEVWKFVNYISSEVPESNKEKDRLAGEVQQLKLQVKAIQMKLNL